MIRKGKYIAVRPNSLIEARYDLTTKQNDILDMVLCQIEDDNNYLYELNLNDFKKLYNSDTSNIYRDLKKAVKEFEGKGFYLIDSENKKEIFFIWFASIYYSDNEGKIVVEVGQRLKSLLVEMKKRIFYKIEYPLNFKSIYSKRIYYYLKSFQDTGWRIDNLDNLRKKLQCPASYNKYGLFRIKVLEQAQQEINNFSDIDFNFEEIKAGRKVTCIKFIIKNTKEELLDIAVCLENQYLYDNNEILNVKNIFSEKISDDEAFEIFKASKENISLIKEKYALTKKSSGINNIVGWVISAMKEDYKNPKSKVNKGTFTDYEQRDYDFEELEKKLLGWK